MAPKRKSLTEDMASNAEKILSAVERGLIKIIDSECEPETLKNDWPCAPTPCLVILNIAEFNYAYLVRDRLKGEGFEWDAEAKRWYRRKLPGQLSLEQRARMEKNKAAALQKLARRAARDSI